MPSADRITASTFALAVYHIAELIVLYGIIPTQLDVKALTINTCFGTSAADWPLV